MAGYDRSGYTNMNMEIAYPDGEVVDISTSDHTFTKGPARGLIVTATGNVAMVMEGGTTLTIPVVVTAGHFIELRGFIVKTIKMTVTTATVYCGMY